MSVTYEQAEEQINRLQPHEYTNAQTMREVLGTMLNFANDGIKINAEGLVKTNENVEDNEQEIDGQQKTINDHSQDLKKLNELIEILTAKVIELENNEENQLFDYSIQQPINDKDGNFSFWYSFRGVTKHYVNYTFRIAALTDVRGESGRAIILPTQRPDMIRVLRDILKNSFEKKLSFTVSYNYPENTTLSYKKLCTTTFEIPSDAPDIIVHRFYPYNIIDGGNGEEEILFHKGEEIHTSIMMHIP